MHFPIENKKMMLLIAAIQKNSQRNFLQKLQLLINEYNIPFKEKYSNDLIFDDFSQPNLILFVENLFNFNEVKQIIDKIKTKNKELQFYIYQIDENNQEKKGCYIIFDNYNLEFENNKLNWITFFQNLFSNHQYTFPYNNIFCYPEIKFIGKQYLLSVEQLLTNCTNIISTNKHTKEVLIATFINEYIAKYNNNIESYYNFYLAKLNATTHTSNYLTNNQEKIETKFLTANETNEDIAIKQIINAKKNAFNIQFPVFYKVPIWFHYQVIDLLISPILKTDYEKLFYINCIKKINVQISKL